MQEINVQNLDSNNVLLVEHKKNVPQNQVKYYISDHDNADRFVSSKQNEKNINIFHHIVSAALSAVSGVYIGAKIKANVPTKIIGGTAAAGGVYAGMQVLDKYTDIRDTNSAVKRFKLEDITSDNERVEAVLETVKQTDAAVDKSASKE